MTHLLLLLAVACGPKAPPDPGPDPGPEPIPEPDPVPDPAPHPDPDPQPPTASNADFEVTFSLADGTVAQGRVIRVERTEDWYGEEGWTSDPAEIELELEGPGTLSWDEVAAIDIRYAGSQDASCMYDSSYDPLMYLCVLPTESTALTRDGERHAVADRHRWRFTFEDDRQVAFYVHKLPVRAQDEAAAGIDLTENPAMYEQLLTRLADEKARAPSKIVLSP